MKIRAHLDQDEFPTGETFWAEPVGDETYILRNVPFFAYDLHYGDKVRAYHNGESASPTIVDVVARSGNKTLRVFFGADISPEEVGLILKRLDDAGASTEKYNAQLFALDVEAGADYAAICDYLWQLEQRGRLHYETGATSDAEAPPHGNI